MEKSDIKIYKPQEGFQEYFSRSNVDIVIGGGVMGCGKTFAACLSVAEPCKEYPDFRAVFLRKQAVETKAGGGLMDDMKMIYRDVATFRESGTTPRVTFPNGSFVDMSHMNNEEPDALLERVKGWQYDLIYFDEGTGYEWTTFLTLMGRNRGKSKFSGKIRMTTNPKKSHWLRLFLDWWIGLDGYIIPERSGVVRYFYVSDKSVESVVWGDSKEEVYAKCRIQIDRQMRNMKDMKWENLIKSCTFYLGNLSQNKEMLKTNEGYIGSVAAMGAKVSQANLEGNWNVDPYTDDTAPIKPEKANEVFLNDAQRNNDRWLTCDLADTGTDNFLILSWNGFHIDDFLILQKSTPRLNADTLRNFAQEKDVSDSHIIYDAIRGIYINDYIPDAIPFFSNTKPIGLWARSVMRLKDECYLRLVNMVNNNRISVDESVSRREYTHQNMATPISFQCELLEEMGVVRFKEQTSGKKMLYGKKEMNAMLGKGRSMDILDPIAMRMYPVLGYQYGEELSGTMVIDEPETRTWAGKPSIYSDDTWI